MGFGSLWHWVIVLLVVVILFGAGKIPQIAGDLAKGIKSFKKGLKEEGDVAASDKLESKTSDGTKA